MDRNPLLHPASVPSSPAAQRLGILPSGAIFSTIQPSEEAAVGGAGCDQLETFQHAHDSHIALTTNTAITEFDDGMIGSSITRITGGGGGTVLGSVAFIADVATAQQFPATVQLVHSGMPSASLLVSHPGDLVVAESGGIGVPGLASMASPASRVRKIRKDKGVKRGPKSKSLGGTIGPPVLGSASEESATASLGRFDHTGTEAIVAMMTPEGKKRRKERKDKGVRRGRQSLTESQHSVGNRQPSGEPLIADGIGPLYGIDSTLLTGILVLEEPQSVSEESRTQLELASLGRKPRRDKGVKRGPRKRKIGDSSDDPETIESSTNAGVNDVFTGMTPRTEPPAQPMLSAQPTTVEELHPRGDLASVALQASTAAELIAQTAKTTSGGRPQRAARSEATKRLSMAFEMQDSSANNATSSGSEVVLEPDDSTADDIPDDQVDEDDAEEAEPASDDGVNFVRSIQRVKIGRPKGTFGKKKRGKGLGISSEPKRSDFDMALSASAGEDLAKQAYGEHAAWIESVALDADVVETR